MSVTAQAIAHRSRSSLAIAGWASVAYLVFAAVQLVNIITTMVSRLNAAASGRAISLDFNPRLAFPQPAGYHFSGAPYVVPGTTMTIDHATATVAHVPSSVIALQSAGDIVGDLAGAGVALCVLLLVRWIIQGRPFAAAAPRVLVALAIIVIVGFEAQTALHGSGTNWLAGRVMFSRPVQPDGSFTFTSTADLLTLPPFYIGAALLGLAAAFRVGASLEKDTEGLV